MTLTLPPHPHLDWLKNRAKEKLLQLRSVDPGARLAAAQLGVAREYGYSSWRALRAQVATLRLQSELGQQDLPPVRLPLDAELVNSFGTAIREGSPTVNQMLDANPDLAHATIDGETALQWAVDGNQIGTIRALLGHGVHPDTRSRESLHTPLSWAITCDWPDACKTLVDGGATVDLFCAAGMGLVERVRSFFDEAGHVRAGASMSGSSRWHDGTRIAVLSTDPVEVISDALYIACRTGRVEAARQLLDYGADPNFRAFMGATCFQWTYFGGGDPRLVESMLAHGADPGICFGEEKWSPRAFGILITAGWGMRYYVNRILTIDPSLAQLSEGGTTPLHRAVSGGSSSEVKLDIVKMLLACGADPGQVDAQGKTPHDIAVALNEFAIAALLVG